MTIKEMLQQMIEKMQDMEKDAEKVDGGQKSAGVRLRKGMQQVKADAQDMRIAINELSKK